jgi:RNA polymerase sigma factor (sigma-70 family)
MTITFESLFSVALADESCLATNETPQSELLRREITQDLRALLEMLSERHREVLASHFGIGRREESGVEMAERLGLSKQRVSQLIHAAIRSLKSKYEETKDTATEI